MRDGGDQLLAVKDPPDEPGRLRTISPGERHALPRHHAYLSCFGTKKTWAKSRRTRSVSHQGSLRRNLHEGPAQEFLPPSR